MGAKASCRKCLNKYAGISSKGGLVNKFWFFFYGWPNIVGMALMLLGLAVHIALMALSPKGGLLYWWVMVLGLYVLGWLVGWFFQNNDADLHFRQALTAEQIKAELDSLVRKIAKRVPEEALSHVKSIRESVAAVLPQIVAGSFGSHDLFTIKKTVFNYLPETLENYLRLPTVYANVHPIQNGKTAKTLLVEQLTIIDTTMSEVVQNIYNQDAQALLVNEKFLKSRFEVGRL